MHAGGHGQGLSARACANEDCGHPVLQARRRPAAALATASSAHTNNLPARAPCCSLPPQPRKPGMTPPPSASSRPVPSRSAPLPPPHPNTRPTPADLAGGRPAGQQGRGAAPSAAVQPRVAASTASAPTRRARAAEPQRPGRWPSWHPAAAAPAARGQVARGIAVQVHGCVRGHRRGGRVEATGRLGGHDAPL